MFGQRIAA